MSEIKVKLQPFRVPNFVLEVGKVRPREDGYVQTKGHPLADLDDVTLNELCDEFRVNVFKKARAT